MNQDTICGFVALLGKPNAGKSTLVNALIKENIALVSHKAGATRRKSNNIVMHKNAQIIFVDTPGLDNTKTHKLNSFMQEQACLATKDCDLIVYLISAKEDICVYENLLAHSKAPHILALSKIDLLSKDVLLKKISQYQKYGDYLELIPLSAKKNQNLDLLLDLIAKNLPKSPFLYDEDILSTSSVKEVYQDLIREAVFDNISDEIPYRCDVLIDSIMQKSHKEDIEARLIVEKNSQKRILIGKKASTIKRIGIHARKLIENFSHKKINLRLSVQEHAKWFDSQNIMSKMGYHAS